MANMHSMENALLARLAISFIIYGRDFQHLKFLIFDF
jgi:hypothetical protein